MRAGQTYKRITALAKDEECQVRIPGVCNFDNSTTIAAHYRLMGITGMGFKDPDLDMLAAWACSNCHDAVDRRRYLELNYNLVRLLHAEGVFRTIAILKSRGVYL